MRNNRAAFTADALAQIFGQQALHNFRDFRHAKGVCTDSRTLQEECIFLALSGDRFNGHDFLPEANSKGAAVLIIAETERERLERYGIGLPAIIVPCTLEALGKLANYHRRRFRLPILAVAGSAGKTTTKEMCRAVLATRYTTLYTEGNYNNRIGVPLTLLQLEESHSAAVLEIGTNEPGEIEKLCAIAEPDSGLITNIGKEHLEKLVDLDGVEREETALFRYLAERGGRALVNMDDPRLAPYAATQPALCYGNHVEANVQARFELNAAANPLLHLRFGGEECTIRMATIGMASALNAIAAAAAGIQFGIPPAAIRVALEAYRTSAHGGIARMHLETIGGVHILNDCYNAHPASMRAALHTLGAMHCAGQKIALLGDMLELGQTSLNEHCALLQDIREHYPGVLVILTGAEMQRAWAQRTHTNGTADTVLYAASIDDCANLLSELLQPGDLLLVKGSRGIALEKVLLQLSETLSS